MRVHEIVMVDVDRTIEIEYCSLNRFVRNYFKTGLPSWNTLKIDFPFPFCSKVFEVNELNEKLTKNKKEMIW